MKYSKATLALFLASTASTMSIDFTADALNEIVGDGCTNKFTFRSLFVTETDSSCESCVFCDGSASNSIFIPDKENTCIDCSTADNACKALKVITSFDKEWLMDFFSLSSSSMGSETDPAKVLLQASNDLTSWKELYNSKLTFTEREKAKGIVLSNDESYKYYSITFVRKPTSAKMHLGRYGLVENYTKGCAAKLYQTITGDSIRFDFTDRESLKKAVDLWILNKPQALKDYGDIKYWGTGKVTDMKHLFYLYGNVHDTPKFNDDISLWDTSSATTMYAMFHSIAFNRDISKWNVSNVTTMESMFNAGFFNQDISDWNINKVRDMNHMFDKASAFKQKLCWKLDGKITTGMFRDSSGSIGC